MPDEKLDVELHKVLHQVERDLKQEGKQYFDEDIEAADDDPDYKERYQKYVDKLLDYNSSGLAKYVLHRKTILSLLEKKLKRRGNGYALEDEVHRLLYPMRSTSDDIEFGQQNLWVIDEKLTYHYYLASDLPISKMPVVDSQSNERPDILVFGKPVAFAEGERPFQSIVIIELKRPERNNYPGDDEDPISQVYGYIRKLMDDKIEDADGEKVRLSEQTRFYCYILADLTPKMEELATNASLRKTPDGDGYYGINPNLNAYVEIISYRKLLGDATKRNRVLFDKLGLPTTNH